MATTTYATIGGRSCILSPCHREAICNASWSVQIGELVRLSRRPTLWTATRGQPNWEINLDSKCERKWTKCNCTIRRSCRYADNTILSLLSPALKTELYVTTHADMWAITLFANEPPLANGYLYAVHCPLIYDNNRNGFRGRVMFSMHRNVHCIPTYPPNSCPSANRRRTSGPIRTSSRTTFMRRLDLLILWRNLSWNVDCRVCRCNL